MARTKVPLLFVAVLLVLSGCSAFFAFNAFSGLDKPSSPSPNRYKGSGGLDNLQQDLASPAVVEALKNDPQTVEKILNNLASEHNLTSPTSADDQKAAILYAQLSLQTTSGDTLVNNIVDTVTNNPSGNIHSLLASVVPSDVAHDNARFAAMMTGFLNSYVVYYNLGNNLVPTNPPPGMNMGDVAQKAAVALLVKTIYDDSITPAGGADNVVPELFKVVNNQPSSVSGVVVDDPFVPMPIWLAHIFDAAGASYPS